MRRIFFFIALILFFVSFISASFQVGDLSHNISNKYSSEDFIKGWVNLSFNQENFSSVFTTNSGSFISLFDLLMLNGFVTECEGGNCDIDYDATNPLAIKTVSMVADSQKLVGLKITKDILELNSIDFDISSGAAQSCYNQFKMDVFDDGSIDIMNTNYSNSFCSLFRTKGCFEEGHAVEEVILSNVPICQNVELPESGGFRLGAELIAGTKKSSVDFGIYELDGTALGSCANNSVNGTGEFFCDVDGVISEETKRYYVCATSDVANGVKINYYQDSNNGCGFSGIPPKTEEYAYNIIAYSKQFGSVGVFSIIDRYDGNFLQEAQNYLTAKYGDLDCFSKNCVIPIRIYPKINQDITFQNLEGTAIAGEGAISLSPYFYDLSETSFKYNSGFNQLYFDNASLSVVSSPLSLKLNGNEIFSQTIEVKKVPIIRSINPTITAAAVSTKFSVSIDSIDSNSSITNYFWDFGNGNSENTKTDSIKYIYNNTGEFNLTLKITTSNQLTSSKSFKIKVETPINAVNTTLEKKLSYLEKLKTQLELFEPFYKNSLETILNLADSENKLTKIKIDFDSAVAGVADSYYISLMEDLIEILVPESITISKSADMLPFYFSEDKIDLKALESLSGNYSIGREQDYNDAILSWNLNSLVNTITYKEISADYGDGLEVLLNVFELNINKKPNLGTSPFLVIEKIDNLKFEKDYNKREIGNYVFIPLTEDISKIVFSTTKDISFSELPLFISPQLNNLQILGISSQEEGISIWILFVLILFFLVLLAITVYIILQKWYSKKYENFLFKNKNDLYNLISFIQNSKKKGIEEDKIAESLRKSGWNSEQIRYIIRKYLGKRTGMFELPIEKLLNFFKKKQVEVSKNNVSQRPQFKRTFNPRHDTKRF